MMAKIAPAGVIRQDVKIPAQKLPPDLKIGDFLDVLVGEVYSPGRFYVQLVQSLSYDLDDLVDEMLDTYGSSAVLELEVTWADLRVGLYCAARIDGDERWYRVVVDIVTSTTSVQVSLLDFGGVFSITLCNLRYLLSQFCSLPAQAMLAKLSGLAPPHGCSSWPQASSVRLLDLTRPACVGEEGNRGLVARIEEWAQGGKVELRLFDTVTNTEPGGVDISKVLVEEGLARMISKPSCDIKYLEEMLATGKSYKYSPLRCPNFLRTDQQDEEMKTSNQSSELSEDMSMKTQLKHLLNLQNSVHSLVSKNLVTEQEDEIFTRMTSLQSQYQALLARLLNHTARGGEETDLQEEEESCCLTEQREVKECSSPDSEDKSSFFTPADLRNKEEQYLLPTEQQLAKVTLVKESDSAVTRLSLSCGHTVHPVTWSGDCWVTSAEVSALILHWYGYDLLGRMLERKKCAERFQVLEITAIGEKHLFQEMIVEGVGGMVNKKSGKLLDRVFFYKFADMKNMLEIFNVKINEEDLVKIGFVLRGR